MRNKFSYRRLSRLATLPALLTLALTPSLFSQAPKDLPALNLNAMLSPVPESAAFRDPGYHVWCGTMIRDKDGKYHLFYSRWPSSLGEVSWVTSSEIAHAVGDTPTGPFRFHDVALPARGAKYWDGLVTHNPTIQKFGNKYYLYYMGDTGDGKITKTLNFVHRNNQRVGVAVSDSPAGPWKRFDRPVIDVSLDPTAADSLCTTNPTLTKGRGGKYYLLYKAVGKRKPLPFGGPVVHLMAVSDTPIGPFRKFGKPLFTMPGNDFPYEDPFLWFDSARDRFYVILKDNHGVTTSTHESSLLLFESKDAEDWKPAENSFIDSLDIPWADRPTQHVKRMERPQLMFDDLGRPQILTVAIDEGTPENYNVRMPLLSKDERK